MQKSESGGNILWFRTICKLCELHINVLVQVKVKAEVLVFCTLIDGIYKFTMMKLYKLYAEELVSRRPVQRSNKRWLKLISRSLFGNYL